MVVKQQRRVKRAVRFWNGVPYELYKTPYGFWKCKVCESSACKHARNQTTTELLTISIVAVPYTDNNTDIRWVYPQELVPAAPPLLRTRTLHIDEAEMARWAGGGQVRGNIDRIVREYYIFRTGIANPGPLFYRRDDWLHQLIVTENIIEDHRNE